MKTSLLLLSALSLNCFAEEEQNQRYSIGLGMGAIYSGVGANLALISDNDMKYISTGCVGYSSLHGSTCGFGAGWIKTDLFDFDSNKHGFGIYATLVDRERYATSNNNQYDFQENDVYGVGISYNYFFRGISSSGTIIGLSVHATNAEYKDNYGAYFQIGYQF